MSRLSFGTPLRPKIECAKRFLSLQVSQASHVISDELSNILKSKSSTAKKRRRIIDEIFSSEQSYQEHLYLITTLFLSPLRETQLLPDHAISSIFSNIEAIQNVNRELLTHMETMGLGDAFLALAPFLKLYSTYANNFETAVNTIKDWEKKCPKFAAFKEQQENLEEARGLKLNALLITPIQRIPSCVMAFYGRSNRPFGFTKPVISYRYTYKMLLENLLWKTPDDHADFDKLKEAVDQISNIAIHINENIRQHENFQKMLSIQNSFSREGAPKILAPGRIFLKEGTLLKVGKRGWGSSKERTFFLFSDILIYAKKSKVREKETTRNYVCRNVFPLYQCKVEEVMGDGNACHEGGALFSIECQDRLLLLFSKSQGEAKSWLNEIRNAVSEVHESAASSLRRSTRGGCNLRKTKRRAPVRNTNDKRIGANIDKTSPVKTKTSSLDWLSPRKNEEMAILDEGTLDLSFDKDSLSCRGSESTLEDEYTEGSFRKLDLSFSESPGMNPTLRLTEKENVAPGREENFDSREAFGAVYENKTSQKPEGLQNKTHTAELKRKHSNCPYETLQSDRPVRKRRSARVSDWFLSCSSGVHGPR